ncbi:MAG: TPM domain-containing protein [Spirochaetales bacterium]|nr:TPM domain-containing protein [Spirochaetales bacterium]
MKKTPISPEDRIAVAAAVKKAESATSGEISTALIAESSDYAFFELRASVAFAVLLYIVQLQFYPQISSFVESLYWNSSSWMTPMFIGILSFLGGGLFYFFSNIPAIDRIIIPRSVMNARVRSRALRHFTESGVYATADGTGILIFISLLERRVEILADKGISEKIPEEDWNGMVGELTQSLARKELAQGLIKAVESCGKRLQEHFPIQEDDVNELSDDLVILEE